MPHPDLHNHSRFAHELTLLTDENGEPLVVPILQAVFAIGPAGALTLLDEQPPIALGGQAWAIPALRAGGSSRRPPSASRPATWC